MAAAFQASAFQISAFQTEAVEGGAIVSTAVLHKPIDYVLAGDINKPKKSYRENDVRPMATKQRVAGRRSGVQSLGGSKAAFIARTNNRGYD